VHPAAVLVRRTPPVPAVAAALLGLISAGATALLALLALAFSNGQFGGGGWLVVATSVVLMVGLVVGAVLLLLGRSWLALALPAGALAALALTGYVMGGWGAFGVAILLLPVLTAVLAAAPRPPMGRRPATGTHRLLTLRSPS
jgi:hypothetical protein